MNTSAEMGRDLSVKRVRFWGAGPIDTTMVASP
jgi:hypothetical protein